MFPGPYLYSLVKIGSETAKIFLIWANVARTNVALTNVAMTVGICSRCSQETTFIGSVIAEIIQAGKQLI